MKKRRVVIGVLGTVLDKRGKRANRFKKWRPTVGLCQQPDFPVDRLELLHQPRDESMAQRLIEDVALLSPDTEVRPHAVTINDPWDFEEVYAAFLDFATRYSFDTENEEYLVHITTGTHVAQICWFLLTEARYLPASLLQTSPAPKGASEEDIAAGVCSVIDLDLSRYATLTSRFQREQQQSVSFLKAGIDTRNATFNKLIDRIERVALRSTDPILLTGPTGAGKTTMVKLLMRFYDVDSGSITLNGHDVRDFDRSALREGFGMVLQDTWLFKGTIMENIRYGRLDATDEEVIAAAKAANADHFIRTLPGGYQMELNEDASNVSQGQKQLLTIARTILADNRILILDEATSSVDTRTEQRIQTAMDRLMEGRTSFVIAHRLSTIRDADLILVMRDGDIVEQGTHDQLIEAGGFYADLYNSQFEDVVD